MDSPSADHLETSPGGSAELMELRGARLEPITAPLPSWSDGCAIRRAGLARPRDGVSRLGLDVHRARDRHPRPAAVPRDVGAPSHRGRRAPRVRASTRRSRRGSDRPAAGGRRVRLRRVAVRDGARLAGVVPADRAGRCGGATRGDDPDLDGPLRPRRVRKASRGRCLSRHRRRLRRAGVPLRPVRRGIGRSRRRSRDRRERDVLGDRISVFTRRAATESPSRLRWPRLALRRHPAHGLLRRLGRDRRGDVDERRAPRARLPHRRGQLRRFHRLRVAASGGPDLARLDLRLRQSDRRRRARLADPRRERHARRCSSQVRPCSYRSP